MPQVISHVVRPEQLCGVTLWLVHFPEEPRWPTVGLTQNYNGEFMLLFGPSSLIQPATQAVTNLLNRTFTCMVDAIQVSYRFSQLEEAVEVLDLDSTTNAVYIHHLLQGTTPADEQVRRDPSVDAQLVVQVKKLLKERLGIVPVLQIA